MNLKELIERPDNKPLYEKECCFILKNYIKIRKDQDIDPYINYSMGDMIALLETQRMVQMVSHAVAWFRGNKELI